MKLIKKGDERSYYGNIIYYGFSAGLAGVAVGTAAAVGLTRYWPSFRRLDWPFRASVVFYPGFIALSAGANHGAMTYRSRVHPELRPYVDESERKYEGEEAEEPREQRFEDWIFDHKLTVIGTTWLGSMVAILERMRRDHLTSTARKLVQARVFAQASTIAILLLIAAAEAHDMKTGRGKYATVFAVDPENPAHRHLVRKLHREDYPGEDLWKDIVERAEDSQKAKTTGEAGQRKA